MTVYLVVSGLWDDYDIRGIFTRREYAEAYAKEWDKANNVFHQSEIVPTETDEKVGYVCRTVYPIQGGIPLLPRKQLVPPGLRLRRIKNGVESFVSANHARQAYHALLKKNS